MLPHGASTGAPCTVGSPGLPGWLCRRPLGIRRLRACDWRGLGCIPLQVGPALARPHPGLTDPPRTLASISPGFALGPLWEAHSGFLSLGTCP